MIVFRVLQVVIALLSVFFLGYSIYAFTGGVDMESGDPYFKAKLYLVLFFAGVIMSALLYYVTRYLSKHLS